MTFGDPIDTPYYRCTQETPLSPNLAPPVLRYAAFSSYLVSSTRTFGSDNALARISHSVSDLQADRCGLGYGQGIRWFSEWQLVVFCALRDVFSTSARIGGRAVSWRRRTAISSAVKRVLAGPNDEDS